MSIGTYGEADAVSNAIEYAKFFSRTHDAVICIYDDADNVIDTHEHKGSSKSTKLACACRGLSLWIVL